MSETNPEEVLADLDFETPVDAEEALFDKEFHAGIRGVICAEHVFEDIDCIDDAIESVDDFADYLRALKRAGYEIDCDLDDRHYGISIEEGRTVPEWMKSEPSA